MLQVKEQSSIHIFSHAMQLYLYIYFPPFRTGLGSFTKKYTKIHLDDRKLFNWPFEPQTVDRVGLGEWAIVRLSVVTLTVCSVHLPCLPAPINLTRNQDSPGQGTVELKIQEKHLKKQGWTKEIHHVGKRKYFSILIFIIHNVFKTYIFNFTLSRNS